MKAHAFLLASAQSDISNLTDIAGTTRSFIQNVRSTHIPFVKTLPSTTSVYHKWPPEHQRHHLPDYLSAAVIEQDGRSIDDATLMGPPIHVQAHDQMEVTLINSLPSTGLSIHWHGFEMERSIEYDGVTGITQCPVSPQEQFIYNFTVEEMPGTYWYHTHSGNLGINSYNAIHGPLIVHPPGDEAKELVDKLNGNGDESCCKNPLAYENERILFFSDGFLDSGDVHYALQLGGLHPVVTKDDNGFSVGTAPWEFGTCNGKLREVIRVVPGETYKLRLINGGTHFALRVHIAGFPMAVVAADSEPVIQKIVDEVILHAAERFDVLLTIPDDATDGDRFWIRADTLESTKQGFQNGIRAILSVASNETVDSDLDEGTIPDPIEPIGSQTRTTERLTLNCYSEDETLNAETDGGCLSITDLQFDKQTSEGVAGGEMVSNEPSDVHTVDFMFQAPPQHAHFVRIDSGKYRQHVNPQFSMLSPEFDPTTDMHPNTAVLHVPAHANVIIIWRNKSLMDHPVHLHGLKMEILGIHRPNKLKDCTLVECRLPDVYESAEAIQSLDSIPPNQAVLKDTVVMPAGGAVATRIRTGDPALWFAHCHLEIHRENGMALIMNVGNYSSPRDGTWLPADYPDCNSPFMKSKSDFPACPCYINEDAVLDTALTEDHFCSRDHLCDYVYSMAANAEEYIYPSGVSLRSDYDIDNWAIALIVMSIIAVVAIAFVVVARIRNKEDKKEDEETDRGGDKPELTDIQKSIKDMEDVFSQVDKEDEKEEEGNQADPLDGDVYDTSDVNNKKRNEQTKTSRQTRGRGSTVLISTETKAASEHRTSAPCGRRGRNRGSTILVSAETKAASEHQISAPDGRRGRKRGSVFDVVPKTRESESSVINDFVVDGFQVVGEIHLSPDESGIDAKSPFTEQLKHLVGVQWESYRPSCVNLLRVFEVAGLALLTGVLFYDVGSDGSASGLGAKISLLFFSTTLWTFTRMYPAVTSYFEWRKMQKIIFREQRFSIGPSCLARFLVSFAAEGWWPFIYVFVCYTMAGIAGKITAVFQIGVFLALNTLCYMSIGSVLGILCPSVPIGMITSTIISQTSLVAAGFYTTLPPVIELIRFISPVYWTFKGIAKTAFSWSDTFTCMKGQGDVGPNECFIEFSIGIDNLKSRGINVATYGDPDSERVYIEMLVLILLYATLQFSIYLCFFFKYNNIKLSKTNPIGKRISQILTPTGSKSSS